MTFCVNVALGQVQVRARQCIINVTTVGTELFGVQFLHFSLHNTVVVLVTPQGGRFRLLSLGYAIKDSVGKLFSEIRTYFQGSSFLHASKLI